MRAVAKLAPSVGAMAVIDRTAPVRTEGEVLIRIAAAGICGTDVAIWKWHEAVVGQYAPHFPLVVGHEFAGYVVEAPPSGPAPGTLVAVNPQIGCGRCRFCGLGRPTLCDDRRLMGGHIDGGWTELICVPAAQVYPLPEGTDPAVASLLEPLAVAVHAVCERVPVRPGDVVAVIGAGPIGLLVGLVALKAGASEVLITGISADKQRLDIARGLGLTPVNVEAEDPMQCLGKAGADVVYETSGSSTVAAQMLALAAKAGRVGLIGLCHGPSTFVTTPAVLKELELIGSRGYNDPTWQLTMRLLPSLAPKLSGIATHRFRYEDFQEALAMVERRQGLKVLLEP